MELRPVGITKAHLKRANIGQDYWDVDFGNYRGPDTPATKTKKYLLDLAVMKEAGIGILYVGPPGPGKTTLAMIAMKYLLRAHWDVFCTSLGEIVENVQKSWKANDEERAGYEAYLERAKHVDFLYIDDVGKEHRGQSGFVQTIFDNLIRYRVQHRLPTFLTSNLTKSELEGTYGESLMSLLEGKLYPIPVTGDDFRKSTQRHDLKQAFGR